MLGNAIIALSQLVKVLGAFFHSGVYCGIRTNDLHNILLHDSFGNI